MDSHETVRPGAKLGAYLHCIAQILCADSFETGQHSLRPDASSHYIRDMQTDGQTTNDRRQYVEKND